MIHGFRFRFPLKSRRSSRMGDFMLSIIIMTRNEAKNIGRMLTSIEQQGFNGDYEVIVVDADSKDRTRDIIMSYSHRLPIHIIDGVGRGIGQDRNVGGQHANGEILVFTEGDCYFKAGLFDHLVILFSDSSLTAWSSCAFPLHSPWYVTLTYKFYDVARYLLTRMRIGFSTSGAIIVVRKNVFTQIGGFPGGTEMNDDGILGRKVYDVCKRRGRYVFSIDPQFSIFRAMNRFDKGYFQALDHYLYVITNYFPCFRSLLKNKMVVDGRKFTNEN